MKDLLTACPVERTLQVVGGRWKIFILMDLLERTMRFGELQRAVNARVSGDITAKMLAQELRQMEADGLVSRHVYAEVPPKVEYSLTPLGRSLQHVVGALREWGQHEAVAVISAGGPNREDSDRDTSL